MGKRLKAGTKNYKKCSLAKGNFLWYLLLIKTKGIFIRTGRNALIGFDFRFARRFSIPFGHRPLVLNFVIKKWETSVTDYVWHELNSTHNNGLRSLLASRDAAEAARNAFGWYEFSVGPEGAVAAMNNSGQKGALSLNQGVQFASQLMGQPVPQIVNLPQQQIPQAPIDYTQGQTQGVAPPLSFLITKRLSMVKVTLPIIKH